MMQKLLALIVVLVLCIAGIAAATFYTSAGQDALFKRAATAVMTRSPDSIEGLRVLVCGSASPLGNMDSRAQACIAVMTPEHLLLFDVGARSPLRLAQAQAPMAKLSAVFLTHFHSDHIGGLPDVNLASWVQGRTGPMEVFGPQGVDRVISGFNTAYELDRSYRSAHHGSAMLPPDGGVMVANTLTAPAQVWQADGITVTAFAVAHPPIEPAVGYRVDYQGRSVVISGDSNATESLFSAARGADLLFHDALSRTLLDPMIEVATTQQRQRPAQIMRDVIDYHADARTLPAQAAAAGIRQLVFYHMVPVPANALAAKMFLRDLPQDIILASDLQTFDLPPNSDVIRIHTP